MELLFQRIGEPKSERVIRKINTLDENKVGILHYAARYKLNNKQFTLFNKYTIRKIRKTFSLEYCGILLPNYKFTILSKHLTCVYAAGTSTDVYLYQPSLSYLSISIFIVQYWFIFVLKCLLLKPN